MKTKIMKKTYTFIFHALLFFGLSTNAKAQFTNSGNFKIHAGAAISFFGDLNNNSTFLDSGLVVNLAGTTAQTISGSSIITFNNLTVNNSNATGITLAQKVNVRGNLTMNDGVVNTTATNILQLNNSATSTGASNNSFVSGPVCKIGNQAFIFPVGKNLVHAPIAISSPAAITDEFTAEYFESNPNPLYDVNSKDASLDHVSQCEYWMLDRNTGMSNVTVNLSWDTRSCGITNVSDLRVANWSGLLWSNQGNAGTTGTIASGTIVSNTPSSTFGAFTIASSSSANPLPIGLINFTGECIEGNITIEWSTASETNNDYFTLERSVNGINWISIHTIQGAGNSTSILNYIFTDNQPNNETSYYRLKQTDFDGTIKYSEIIDIEACKENTTNELTVFPNPSTGTFNFVFNGNMNEVNSIEVYNLMGERIYSGKPLSFISLSDEQVGVYFFHLNLHSETIVKKIVLFR